MDWLAAPDYWMARLVFQRGLAAVYLLAFVVAVNQFRALIGKNGLTPVPAFLNRVSFRRAPSLFHLYYSDRFFAAVAWTGVALSAAALLGFADLVPLWGSMLLWAILWVLYLSIVNVGQLWYGFGWESLLCETGLIAVFLGNSQVPPPFLTLLLLRWLLVRLEVGAGLIKLRGDPCWRDLTCLYYHHETQPMPGPLSWWFHHLPRPLHRAEVGANHVTQLVVPFALFAPQPYSTVAAAIIIVTQLWLVLSGNFAWLNWLTIVLATSAVDWPGGTTRHTPAAPAWHDWSVMGVTGLVVVLSYWPVRNMISRHQKMNASFNRLHLVNTYGAFGSISRARIEVAIEGTDEAQISPDTVWREYEFKGKPGPLHRRPPQFAPYHLRLDWLMWFAALSPGVPRQWLVRLVHKLLEGDETTLRLLRHNPFPDAPPTFIRARAYRYHFTTRQEHHETGAWWRREPAGQYLPPTHRQTPADATP
jgi:hypothetical protein